MPRHSYTDLDKALYLDLDMTPGYSAQLWDRSFSYCWHCLEIHGLMAPWLVASGGHWAGDGGQEVINEAQEMKPGAVNGSLGLVHLG